MKSLVLIAALAYGGYHFSDVRGGGIVGAYLAPLLLFVSLIFLAVWIKQRSLTRNGSPNDGEGPITVSPSDFE